MDVNVDPPEPFLRPAWALDGSFLTLRYLFQLVSEFTKFLEESADPLHGITADLIRVGARLVDRWKSGTCTARRRTYTIFPFRSRENEFLGASTDLFPLQDNLGAGTNPSRRNNFTYDPNS